MYLADMGEVSKAATSQREKWEGTKLEQKRRRQDRVRAGVAATAGAGLGAYTGGVIGGVGGAEHARTWAHRNAPPRPEQPEATDWRQYKRYTSSGGDTFREERVRTPGGASWQKVTDPKTRQRAENIHARWASTKHPGEKANAESWLRSRGIDPHESREDTWTTRRVRVPGGYNAHEDLLDDMAAKARARTQDYENLRGYRHRMYAHSAQVDDLARARQLKYLGRGAAVGAGLGAVGVGYGAIKANKKKREYRFKQYQKRQAAKVA